MDRAACLVAGVAPAMVKGVGLQNGAPSAAVGVVVYLILLVFGVVADLVGFDADVAPLLGTA